jgi:hypothetical protein
MSVCEFLHCTKSELGKRLKKGNGYADYFLIMAYKTRKGELEEEAVDNAKTRR